MSQNDFMLFPPPPPTLCKSQGAKQLVFDIRKLFGRLLMTIEKFVNKKIFNVFNHVSLQLFVIIISYWRKTYKQHSFIKSQKLKQNLPGSRQSNRMVS